MNACRVISRVSAELQTDSSDIHSVSIIRVSVADGTRLSTVECQCKKYVYLAPV